MRMNKTKPIWTRMIFQVESMVSSTSPGPMTGRSTWLSNISASKGNLNSRHFCLFPIPIIITRYNNNKWNCGDPA